MYICNILPAENVAQYEQRYEMYLAPEVLKHPERYKEIAQGRDSYKILDNGCYELGSSLPMEQILEAARIINANEIILPDTMGDAEETIKATLEALKTLHKIFGIRSIPYKLMAVIQGSKPSDYGFCAEVYKSYPEITTLGIPKNFCKDYHPEYIRPASRSCCAMELKETYPTKEIHMLGVISQIHELKCVANIVRSCDTSLMVENVKHDRENLFTWVSQEYSMDVPLSGKMIDLLANITKSAEDYLNGNDQ